MTSYNKEVQMSVGGPRLLVIFMSLERTAFTFFFSHLWASPQLSSFLLVHFRKFYQRRRRKKREKVPNPTPFRGNSTFLHNYFHSICIIYNTCA